MACVRLARYMEVLVSVLGKLLEEEGEKRIDILAGSDGVAD